MPRFLLRLDMPDAESIDDAIDDAIADGNKRVKTRFGTREREEEKHSIPDLLAAKKDRGADAAVASAGRLIFNKISPPGAA